ncbi:hypothetical protein B0A52_10197 [Exophiala mesophila]|uniref:Calcineurin-like phosphoesterase domain-containing protein n=1 Tax=Exophiala mesophila TaxID=212818 RepID=A0A438MRM7_EXOME|nr:hypothetical protein B0A52_10197 [Exophiala mesophila]
MPDPNHPSPDTLFTDHRLRKSSIDHHADQWRPLPSRRSLPSSLRPSYRSRLLHKLDAFTDRLVATLKAPRPRRYLATIFVAGVFLFLLWTQFLSTFVQEERAVWEALKGDMKPSTADHFGINIRPHFPNMIHIQDLDPRLLPDSSKHKSGTTSEKKRLIFVGDIHGCKAELEELLAKVNFDPKTDHLIVAGDMVAKGPDTAGVVDLLRAYKASCVRGNHEDRLLLVADQVKSASLRSNKPKSGKNPDTSVQDSFTADTPEIQLAKALNAEQLDYLRRCPVILRVGEMKALGGQVVVVHGGLVPGVGLMDQDPASVMNMRVIDLKTHVPSKSHERAGSVPWYHLWNKYQQLVPATQRLAGYRDSGRWSSPTSHTTVVYGHDSKKGLILKTYTKGLDSGCVRGGKLTALVAGDNGKHHIVQVKCKKSATGALAD